MSPPEWDNAPNLQKAIETTIPTLSGLMIGFLGALFIAAAITDVQAISSPAIDVYPLAAFDWGLFQIPFKRRYLVMLFSGVAGLCFYRSIINCIWAQMSFYNPHATDNPDVEPLPSDASPELQEKWKRVRENWGT
jgi:hypothetical protein